MGCFESIWYESKTSVIDVSVFLKCLFKLAIFLCRYYGSQTDQLNHFACCLTSQNVYNDPSWSSPYRSLYHACVFCHCLEVFLPICKVSNNLLMDEILDLKCQTANFSLFVRSTRILCDAISLYSYAQTIWISTH